jgi:HEAT repeat protein
MEDPGRVDLLLTALGDSDLEVLKAAVMALKRVEEERVVAALAPLLRHGDAGVRAFAGQVLASKGWSPPTREEEAWFLVARNQFSRAADLGTAAVAPLQTVLDSDMYSLCVGATQALGKISDPRVVPLLTRALKSPDAAVCVAAVDALSKVGSPKSVEAIMAMLRHGNGHVRAAALDALGTLRLPEAVDSIARLLKDPLWDVRRAAADVLGRCHEPRVLDPLLAQMSDEDPDVREAVVMAIANLGDRRAIEPLVLALADSASGVRRLAAAALARIDHQWTLSQEARSGSSRLAAVWSDLDADVRFFLDRMLGNLASAKPAGAPDTASSEQEQPSPERRRKLSVTLFLSLLSDTDRDLRQAAAQALGEIGESRAVSGLIRALADPDPFVRSAVEQSLRLLDAPNSGT